MISEEVAAHIPPLSPVLTLFLRCLLLPSHSQPSLSKYASVYYLQQQGISV